MSERINVDEPLWDQSTFLGRFHHFMWVTDMRCGLVSEDTLDNAKLLLQQYRKGKEPPGTTKEQVIYAKKLYESAFHPDSGEKQNVFGRMSFQVPGGVLLIGAMLKFYRSAAGLIFWQWVNQSFNALVNYTNRNAKSPITTTQLGIAYVSATTLAVITALGCKSYWRKNASRLMQRYVPFAATAASNCVNIPLMRQAEIIHGIDVTDANGNKIGESKFAAVKGISQVVTSRIVLVAPSMLILPIIMEYLKKFNWIRKGTILYDPVKSIFVGCFLIIMVPTACGLFPQRCSLKTSTLSWLEPNTYEKMVKKHGANIPDRVYFNKGL